MTLNEILLTIAVVTFIIYAVFNIIYLNDLRKTSIALRRFITKTEENLHPVLLELRHSLEDVRRVTSDVSAVIERLRAAVGVLVAVEKSIEGLYGYYREGLGQSTQAQIAGLKAGVKAGVASLLKKLIIKKEGSS